MIWNITYNNRITYTIDIITEGTLTLQATTKDKIEAINTYNIYASNLSKDKAEAVILKENNKIIAQYDNRDIIAQTQSEHCLSVRD